MKTIKKRIPRPQGLTYLIKEEVGPNKNLTLTKDSKPIKYIIEQWILGDLKLNGDYIGYEEMSIWLNLPLNQLVKLGNISYQNVMKLVGSDRNNEELTPGMESSLLKFCLETRAHAVEQTRALTKSQGNEYQAFISTEVNRAIRLEIDSIKPILELLNIMKSGTKNNPNLPNNPTQNNIFCTTEEALKILQDQGNSSVLENGQKLIAKEKELKALPEGLPVIDARQQNYVPEKSTPSKSDSTEITEIHDENDFVG